jgi:hypothetical protein
MKIEFEYNKKDSSDNDGPMSSKQDQEDNEDRDCTNHENLMESSIN